MKFILQIKTVFAVTILSFLLAACSAVKGPVDDVISQPVPSSIHNPQLVKELIMSSGIKLGWIFKEVDSSTLEGTLFMRKYVARITIPYSSTEYSLIFKTSEQLRYDAEEDAVYTTDYTWMDALDQAIQKRLSGE